MSYQCANCGANVGTYLTEKANQAWRAGVERLFDEWQDPSKYKRVCDEWDAVRQFKEELLKNMEASNGKL